MTSATVRVASCNPLSHKDQKSLISMPLLALAAVLQWRLNWGRSRPLRSAAPASKQVMFSPMLTDNTGLLMVFSPFLVVLITGSTTVRDASETPESSVSPRSENAVDGLVTPTAVPIL